MRRILALVLLCACGEAPILTDGGSGEVDAGPAKSDAGLRAFVTSKAFTGNLRAEANAPSSGYEGANTLCKQHAADAGLKGSFVAFVGSSLTSPASRISASGPWSKQLPDGGRTVVLVNLNSAPVANVDVDERGRKVSGDVWTGKSGPACTDWRADTGTGSIGSPSVSGGTGWQDVGSKPCNLKFSLLCLEQ